MTKGRARALLAWGLVVLCLGLIAFGAWVVLANLSAQRTSVTIGGTVIRAQVVSKDDDLMKGLSGVDHLDNGKGMLFVFPADGPQEMWMKDMLIDLDIIWIDKDHIVTNVERDVTPASYPQTFGSKAPARYVLEVPAGTAQRSAIKVGATASFDLPAGLSGDTIEK